jgi:dephospho-CoA kinase
MIFGMKLLIHFPRNGNYKNEVSHPFDGSQCESVCIFLNGKKTLLFYLSFNIMISYYNAYIKHKLAYINLKSQSGGTKNRDVIFITGKAGVGKSTLAEKYVNNGYYLLSFDELIRNKLSKDFSHIETKNLYKLYRADLKDPETMELKERFSELVREKINGNNKVVSEGSIRDLGLIREIFGSDDDFTFYYVVPKSKEEYVRRIFKRFKDDPDNYGRLGNARNLDEDGKALDDYKENGTDGKIISELLNRVANDQYDKIDEQYEYYAKKFDVEKYIM